MPLLERTTGTGGKEMKPVHVRCPKCGAKNYYKNWFDWVLHTPFHWFGKRLTKCSLCGQKSYMKREK
jgi:ribosomal protein L37E